MNYRTINKVCFILAAGSIVLGTLIGLTAIWAEDFVPIQYVTKGLGTTALLLIASTLGAFITCLLTTEE